MKRAFVIAVVFSIAAWRVLAASAAPTPQAEELSVGVTTYVLSLIFVIGCAFSAAAAYVAMLFENRDLRRRVKALEDERR